MTLNAIRQEGYQLLHEGSIELSRVEANGIRIDEKRLAETKILLTDKIREIKSTLEKDEVWTTWRRRFGSKSKITSRDQLATVLFEEMGFTSIEKTETGKDSTEDEALQKIDLPFVRSWAKMQIFRYCLNTSLSGVESEVTNGRLHPAFNLHLARTYRSSSDSPNFHNFPVRDKECAEIIRSLFIPTDGVICENDFKGIEVSMSACYHHDKNFISYITTPGKDMHRDMAAQLYCLEPKQVSKDARYGAKNKFVFPQFYGDFYIACAKALWDWADKGKLTGPDGQSLFKHLSAQGIHELGDCDMEQEPVPGTFECHVKEVENDFWNNRFREYGQWKKDWYKAYNDKGYFDLLTGFRVYGSFRYNEVTNYPVQGSAFHCLLWTLIQVNKALRHYNMKSLVVGQIHDSLIGDIRTDELKDYLDIVHETVEVKLRKHWKWICVPMEIETEICPSNGTWFQKREIKYKDGLFHHPEKEGKATASATQLVSLLNHLNKNPRN